jgi:hypothetical protein
MGERYIFNCPNCAGELYFGNWTNYCDQCFKCKKYFMVVHELKELTKKEYEKYKGE